MFENTRASDRTAPVDLVLLFDISGSVLNDGLPNVRLAIYGFSDELRRYCRPTRDFPALEAQALRRAPRNVDL